MEKIEINQKILSKNDLNASSLRQRLKNNKTFTVNIMSSPGSGKTSLLEKILVPLSVKYNVGVIEGDLQTDNDKKRIEKIGVKAVQIQTGGACHLEADEIERRLPEIDGDTLDLLVIENVGNLVCPSEYDLGQDKNMVLLSVTEGDDKPLKYPSMFFVSDVFILNKIDLAPYVDFNIEKSIANAGSIKNNLEVFKISCKTGEGLDKVISWFENNIMAKKNECGRNG